MGRVNPPHAFAGDCSFGGSTAPTETIDIKSGGIKYADGTTQPTGYIDGTKTNDFGSIASAATGTTTQTVTGAAAGDHVLVDISDRTGWDNGMLISGYVSAADTVTICVTNTTGGAIDPDAKTFNIRVMTR